jgi:hypothetical protein
MGGAGTGASPACAWHWPPLTTPFVQAKNGATNGGNQYFGGGNVADATISQTVDLSAAAGGMTAAAEVSAQVPAKSASAQPGHASIHEGKDNNDDDQPAGAEAAPVVTEPAAATAESELGKKRDE